MKRYLALTLTALMALVGSVIAPKSAEAVPAFARQVGVPCMACHYQHIPKLNSFGREFKLGGMTQTAQELIEDDGISMPPVMNLGFIMKYRYKSETNKYDTGADPDPKVGTERGAWEMYDEAAIWIAGRMAENWGLAVEFPGPAVSTKIVYSKDFGGVQGGLVVYQTDALGAGFGMELFNTGAVKNHRGWENGAAGSAMQAVAGRVGAHLSDGGWGMGSGPSGTASGVTLFAGGDLFFANIGLYGPLTTISEAPPQGDIGFNFSNYFRLAVTPKVAEGMDLMVGFQAVAGSTKGTGGECNENSPFYNAALGACQNWNAATPSTYMGQTASEKITEFVTSMSAIDFQIQTDVGGMSLEVVGNYVLSAEFQMKNVGGDFNSVKSKFSGYSLGGSLGISNSWGVKASYMSITDDTDYDSVMIMVETPAANNKANNTDTAMALGAWWNVAQNVLLMPEYVMWSDINTNVTGGGTSDSGKAESQLWMLLMVGF